MKMWKARNKKKIISNIISIMNGPLILMSIAYELNNKCGGFMPAVDKVSIVSDPNMAC